jgi:TRAP-type mannitol/chloroaromatic compound transport system permease small subunit
MAIAIMWMSWPIFLLALHNNEQSSNAGGLTVWPARLMVPVGFFLLVLQGVSELIKRIGFLLGLCPNPTEKPHTLTPEEELALAIKAQKGEI